MNWTDLIIVIILTLFALEGKGRSFLTEGIELISFIFSLILSLRFYNFTASLIEKHFLIPHSLSNVLGFVAIWYMVEIFFFISSNILMWRWQKFFHIKGETFLSIIPAFFKGIIFVAIILVLLSTFPIQVQIKKEIGSSKIGSFILARTYQLEIPVKNVFGGLAHDTLSFLTIQPKTSEQVNLGFQNSNYYFDESLEIAMLEMVNKERKDRGLSPLSFDVNLRLIARSHGGDMFKRGYFSHYSPEGKDVADRAKEAGIDFLVIGENLAYAPNLELAHQGLMGSPGHRANILSEDYHRVGIGIANGGDFGVMITQVFKN